MGTTLSESIRRFRRERALTQEQLAEALGVTVGAVYKWEAGLSAPGIGMLMELADLFDTSVDVLLGYDVKSSRQADTVGRLKDCLHARDRSGLAEAEKALLRYPNCFDVAYQSAMLYYLFGLINGEKPLIRRSIGLMERAIVLLGQNTDPNVSELSITYNMAGAYFELGENEKALELLKSNNPRGINNDVIGQSLASFCERPEEAVEYLSTALVSASVTLIRIFTGMVNVYFKRGDFSAVAAAMELVLGYLAGLRNEGKSNLFDKPCTAFYVCLAHARLRLGEPEAARAALRAARELAERFDRDPDYTADDLRFFSAAKRQTAFDSLGDTAVQVAEKAVLSLDDGQLTGLWEEVTHER